MTTTAFTGYGVRCANHTERTYHATLEEVRGCHRDGQHAAYQVRCANENLTKDLDLSAFDAPIQERERAEDEAAARDKMDREEWFPANRPAPSEMTEGVYRNPKTGDIFKVYRTVRGANQIVAKKLQILDTPYTTVKRGKEVEVKAEFVYMGKAGLRGLTPEMRMTIEEAKKYGALYGVCVRCSATLTKEESIERAMGPICAGKGNWA
jgi:hypothetical protein